MFQLADLHVDLADFGSEVSVVNHLFFVKREKYLCSDRVVGMEGQVWKIWRTHSTVLFVDGD
jgi:hypothetical protein